MSLRANDEGIPKHMVDTGNYMGGEVWMSMLSLLWVMGHGGDWTDSPPEGRPETGNRSLQVSQRESHEQLGGDDNEDREGNEESTHRSEDGLKMTENVFDIDSLLCSTS